MKKAKLRWRSGIFRPILPAVALAVVLAAPCGAADNVTTLDRFQLWNGCMPVGLLVEGLPDDAKNIGLRKEDIKIAVRARLRSARIFEENADSYLYVNVNILSPAFSVQVAFRRRMELKLPFWVRPEDMDPLTGNATGWDDGSIGVHGTTGSGYILSIVAHHIDRFIDEFLRVNADACRRISN